MNDKLKNKTPNRQGIYAKAAVYAEEAIEVIVKEMRSGDNSNARVGAAKTLLAKVIPDLKALEVAGKDGTLPTFKLVLTQDGTGLNQSSSEVSTETN